MRVYKVVTNISGRILVPRQLVSFNVNSLDSPLCVEYKVGEITTAKTPSAPLMAFTYPEHAQAFLVHNDFFIDHRYQTYLAEATLYDGLPLALAENSPRTESELEIFWARLAADVIDRRVQYKGMKPAPNGTIFCKSIKLLERVS